MPDHIKIGYAECCGWFLKHVQLIPRTATQQVYRPSYTRADALTLNRQVASADLRRAPTVITHSSARLQTHHSIQVKVCSKRCNDIRSFLNQPSCQDPHAVLHKIDSSNRICAVVNTSLCSQTYILEIFSSSIHLILN